MAFSLRNLFYKPPQNGVQKVTVPDRHQYFNNKLKSALDGTSRFDGTHPELCSTVYTCVSLIANNVSKITPHVYRKTTKGKIIDVNHSWETSLSINPDLRLSTAKWLAHSITKMLIEGTSYYYISEYDNNLNLKKELKPLCELDNVVQFEGEIYYKFKEVANWIPSKQLLIFYTFSRDGVCGLSPISAISNELQIQHGAEQTISNFYRNGLFQLLYTELDLSRVGAGDKKKADEYFEKLANEVAGSKNAFQGGLLQVPPMYNLKSIPLPDLKFLESSKFTESKIASIFNIPAYMLNINEGAGGNYSKVEAQQLHFLNNCLSTVLNIYAKEFTYKLLTTDEIRAGYTIDFDYSQLYTLDLESKSLYMKNLFSIGSITPNEVRESFNLEKSDNEFMNMHFIQSQNQAVEKYPEWMNNKLGVTKGQTRPEEDNNSNQV